MNFPPYILAVSESLYDYSSIELSVSVCPLQPAKNKCVSVRTSVVTSIWALSRLLSKRRQKHTHYVDVQLADEKGEGKET